MAEREDPNLAAVEKLLSETCTYYKHVPTDMEGDLWMLAVREFGALPVMRALMEHVGNSAFMPKIGEIRKALGATSANTGLHAFELARAEVERVGPYESPEFQDPAIGLAIQEMGGWVWLNETMPSPEHRRADYESMAKRFGVAYETARVRLNRGEVGPVQCKGLHQISREQSGDQSLRALASASPRITG